VIELLAAESTTATEHINRAAILSNGDLVLRTDEPVGWEDVVDENVVSFPIAFIGSGQPTAYSNVGMSLDNSVLLLNRNILKWSGFPGWLSPTSLVISANEVTASIWSGVHSVVWRQPSVTSSLPNIFLFLPAQVAAREATIDSNKQNNQAAIELLRSWLSGDEEEQRETWVYLKKALDTDRLSDRKLFP
jgi:hypothetical protein